MNLPSENKIFPKMAIKIVITDLFWKIISNVAFNIELCEKEKIMASVTTLGLGKTMEKKLHSVGIHSAEDLKNIGSKQAVFRLKEKYPGTCVVILYHLEAAIRGVEIKQLDDACKSELKAYFKQI